jgi:hypothetical protein
LVGVLEVGAVLADGAVGRTIAGVEGAGRAVQLDRANLAFVSGRVGIKTFGADSPAHLVQEVV